MRVRNFNAGPGAIPFEVLQKARDEFLDFNGNGCSIIELSHRSKAFDEVINSVKMRVKRLYSLTDEFEILFLQGGASLQFAQIPMNMTNGGVAQYVDTGAWTKKAIKEAEILGIKHEVIASSKEDSYSYIPKFKFSDDADYGYICSNNTIYGTQYRELPKTKCPLIVDSSSDLFSRPIDFGNIGLFYGGIQKNGGPSGVVLVIIRKELAEQRDKSNLPTMLRYMPQIQANSMVNTPNTFGIYMLGLTLEWIEKFGGLKEIERYNDKKSKLLYKSIDEMSEFYIGHARADSRSKMNVVFNLANKELEAKFIEESLKNNMIGLKGHRSVGGIRASIYNAVTYEDVEALTSFMSDFAKKNG